MKRGCVVLVILPCLILAPEARADRVDALAEYVKAWKIAAPALGVKGSPPPTHGFARERGSPMYTTTAPNAVRVIYLCPPIIRIATSRTRRANRRTQWGFFYEFTRVFQQFSPETNSQPSAGQLQAVAFANRLQKRGRFAAQRYARSHFGHWGLDPALPRP